MSTEARRWAFYAYAWACPFVLALLPLSTEAYGNAGAWCWIHADTWAESTAWRFTIFYVPLWLSIGFNGNCVATNASASRRCARARGGEGVATPQPPSRNDVNARGAG